MHKFRQFTSIVVLGYTIRLGKSKCDKYLGRDHLLVERNTHLSSPYVYQSRNPVKKLRINAIWGDFAHIAR